MSRDRDHASNSRNTTFKSAGDAPGGIRSFALGNSITITLSATGAAGCSGLMATSAN
jgi:hypothetical protein